ncbi:unnamed protein product [Cuscuta europaea]|uniref:Reverse transcriptase Ty1/copia-type domain-containing protein n=1 Tax=Cuscuta europaea TaxID=41803 RepID=A0A9P1DY97_CUSEU|nr:unnamed protein product [Cuscuta europaea]
MSGSKDMFQDIDDTRKGVVRLGDGKQLTVEGLGTISVHTEEGKKKLLSNVQYVPQLAHNLLSVGQLVSGGYSVTFENGMCAIKDGSTDEGLLKAGMGKNKLFPLDLSIHCGRALVVKGEDNAKLWHLRNVIFDEDAAWDWKTENQNEEETQRFISFDTATDPDQTPVQTPISSPSASTTSSPPTTPLNPHSHTTDGTQDSDSSSSELPRKVRSLIDIYDSCSFALVVTEPSNYEEAATHTEWTQAMEEEIKAIEKNQTWDLVTLPRDRSVIGLKWVYKTKYNSDGSISKHKARLVAKGYAQQEGIDYEETFSPVARFETVRIVLALAAQWKLPVYQLDVKSAFLNGDLLEDVFVEQPVGFVKKGEEDNVYKLKKALYGLKQAPRAWYDKIDSFFIGTGFVRSDNEPTLYVKKEGMHEFIIVCLYVDDIIYFSSSQSMLDSFKGSMTQQFEMTDLGLLQYFLGLEVKQGIDGTFLCQKRYALNLLKRFHMVDYETVKTPMNTNEKLQKCDGTEEADARLYRSLVGGLNYLTHSRPDLAYCVSIVSRYMQSPTRQHLGAARRILKYVAGTLEYGLWYCSVKDCKLRGYTDSDWAGCIDDRKSTSGSVFDIGSGAITWSSKKQETVALSSSEAEYVAAGAAAKQALWIGKLLKDLGCKQSNELELWCDNKSAIAMARNPAYHSRTKHIDVQYHFIRQLVAEGRIWLQYCGTEWQNADLFTKALNHVKHYHFMKRIGMCELGSRGGVESDQVQHT